MQGIAASSLLVAPTWARGPVVEVSAHRAVVAIALRIVAGLHPGVGAAPRSDSHARPLRIAPTLTQRIASPPAHALGTGHLRTDSKIRCSTVASVPAAAAIAAATAAC